MPGPSTSLSPEFALQMDQICDQFESAWQGGECLRIEDLLVGFEGRQRAELLLELVRVEVDLLRSAGQKPMLADYRDRFPNVDWLPVFGDSDTQTFVLKPRSSNELPEISGYEILRRIGRGGMGTVYQARHLRLNRMVALKIVEGATEGGELLARFQREAEAIALLQHPHIVQIHEVGESGGQPFLALEYIDGGNLADRLRGEPQPAMNAARLVETLARTIHAAHERGVVHRDLKPANILLVGVRESADSASTWLSSSARIGRERGSVYGVPKIADFGLSKRRDDDAELTVAGAIFGTPSYMAPEQAAGETSSFGPAVDVYALGAILYEMLTGRPPFKAPTTLETLELVRSVEPLPPTKLQPRVPRDLETICLKCLQKSLTSRYASALELAEELDRFLNGEPIRTRPVGRFERTLKWAQRHPATAWLIAICCVSSVVLIGAWAVFTTQLAEERRLADVARIHAEKLRDAATRASREAVTARDDALDAKERSRRAMYAAHIQLAHQEWIDGNVARMRTILNGPGCLPKSSDERDWRNWEWYFLSSLTKTELRSFTSPILRNSQTKTASADDGFHISCFTPDGRKLLAADWLGGRGVHVFDVETGVCEKTLTEHQGPVQYIAFSPSGRQLVTAGRINSGTFLRDADSYEVQHELPHPDHVSSAVFTSDARKLVTSCWDGKVRIWDTSTGQLQTEWQASQRGLLNLQLARDGRRLATSGIDRIVRLWTPPKNSSADQAWKEEAKFEGHRSQTSGLAFSPDGSTLASSSEDGEIRLWNVQERRLSIPLRHHAKWVFQLAFSPDGRWLAAASDDKTVSLIDPVTFRVVRRFRGHESFVRGVTFSPDGRLLATSGLERQVKLWDVSRTVDEYEEFDGPRSRMLDIAVMPDGKSVVAACRDGTVRVWDIASRTLSRTLPASSVEMLAVTISPNGRFVAATAFENQPVIKVWETHSWQLVSELTGHTGLVMALAFSPDSQRLASGSYDLKVHVWNMATRQIENTLAEPVGRVNSVAWTPDGRKLVIGGERSDVLIWNLDDQQSVRRLGGHAEGVNALAVFDYGRRAIVAAGDFQLRIWNLETAQLEHSHFGHAAPITRLSVSSDNQRLATASYDNTIRLWDIQTGLELVALEPSSEVEYAMAFNPKTQSLFEASAGGTLRIWDAPIDPHLDWQQRRKQHMSAHTWHELSLLGCLAQGNAHGARLHVQRLAELDPENPSLLRFEADVAARLRDWRTAAQALSEEIDRQPHGNELTPDLRDLFYRAALCWRHSGDDAEYLQLVLKQLDWFEAEATSNSANSIAWNCSFGPLQGELAVRAIDLAERCVRLEANRANTNTLGTAYIAVGRDAEAIAAIERSMTMTPLSAGTSLDWYVLAIAHHRLGNELLAREWFEKARRAWRPVEDSKVKSQTIALFSWDKVELELFDAWCVRELATPHEKLTSDK